MLFEAQTVSNIEPAVGISGSGPEVVLPAPACHPTISLEYPGSPATGRINIIKQIHSVKNEDSETTRKIGLYQKQILDQLIRTQPHRHIFLEGLQTDFHDCTSKEFSRHCFNELTHWDYLQKDTSADNCAAHISRVFSGYSLNSKPSEEQLQYLGALGGGIIFAICYEGVSLHKTTTPEFESKLTKVQSHFRNKQTAINRCGPIRERQALRHISGFLESHPGDGVELIYGNFHCFRDAATEVFQGQKSPAITAADWPDLTVQLGWCLGPHYKN